MILTEPMKSSMLFLLALCLPLSAALPYEAADLKAKRDAKIAEINKAYAAELEKVQKKAMAAGNLEGANEVQKEIATVVVNPFNPLVGKWKWGKSLVAEFSSDGKAKADGYSGYWTENKSPSVNRNFTVKWNNGAVIDDVTLDSKGNKAKCSNSRGEKFDSVRIETSD